SAGALMQTEIIPTRISNSRLCWRGSGSWTKRGPQRKRDLRSIQTSPFAAIAMPPTHGATVRPSLLGTTARLSACEWPVRQRGAGLGSPAANRPGDHKVITPPLQPNVADAFMSNLGVKGQAALTRNLR